MGLIDVKTALADPTFTGRFEAACLTAAYPVLNEPPETAHHARREAWARRIIGGDGAAFMAESGRRLVRFALATNPTIRSVTVAATDQDIEYIVASALGSPDGLDLLLR